MKGRAIVWTDKMKSFIQDNYYWLTTKELTDQLNKEFGLNLNWTNVASYKKRNNLRNGLPKHFEKGHVPANKGQKMSPEVYEKCKGTMFKRGQTPATYRPVGSERINRDGYIEIKVKDPKTWELKHRVVWEAANGPIPKGCTVIFLDGDSTNCKLSNLKLIKRSELLIMNRYHLFQDSAELNDTATNLAKMIDVMSIEKKKKE